MTTDEGMSPERIKHLELIQAIVTRLSGNSFLIKGWAITVAGVFYAYVAAHLSWQVATVSLLPPLAFWGLDAYYLRQERLFRCLYNDVRATASITEPFSMDISTYRPAQTWLMAATSLTIVILYGTIVAVGFLVLLASLVSR